MAQVEILGFCSFYNEQAGVRGSDKIWGIAQVENTLVTFWGRRGSTLRFKTHLKSPSKLSQLRGEFSDRCNRRSGDRYTPISNPGMIQSLVPNLASQISSNFYSAMSRGTLNTAH